MFRVTEHGDPVELMALPMEKFFNLNENPFTMNLDLTQVKQILLKADGSLISSYREGPELKLKSKGSISSDQCIDAMNWLRHYPAFHDAVQWLTVNGFTVNMEWCSPTNRIVIGYPTAHLKVLNVRDRFTGEYLPRDTWIGLFDPANAIDLVEVDDPIKFVESIPTMTEDVEGYVILLTSGQQVKIKTNKYLSLHHAKDSVNNPRRLFECVLDEGVDDLRGMFFTDEVAMMLIDQMQTKVEHLYNSMVHEVETFYQANKHLDRKEYAIKGNAEVTRMYFALAMGLYTGKPIDYKELLKKRWKDLGFKDESLIMTFPENDDE
jgi:T4 RnlA family RNA ligase